MIRTIAGHSRTAVAATLAAALTVSSASVAPARADGNGDAIAAAAFFGLVAVAIIAASRNDASLPPGPQLVTPRKRLPAACRFEIRHGPDRGTWYGRRCLVANFTGWPNLPDRCERKVDLPRRHDVTVYKAKCLARFGYRPDEWGRQAGR